MWVFYSGNVNTPGTRFLTSGGDLNSIAAGTFQVQVGRSDLFGTADGVTGGNILEYDFTPAAPVPEPGGPAVVAICSAGVWAIRVFERRHRPATEPSRL
jgi:hypothetical protein